MAETRGATEGRCFGPLGSLNCTESKYEKVGSLRNFLVFKDGQSTPPLP